MKMKMFLLILSLLLLVTNINSFKKLTSSSSSSLVSMLRMTFDNERGRWSSIGVAGQGFIQRMPEDNSR